MAAGARELKCLLLPMAGPGVLVPNTLVGEIVTQQAVRPIRDSADWMLGTGGWRGTEIPLISFERLCRFRDSAPDAAGRYVVLFSLTPEDPPPYYGVRIEALPRSETVDADRLESHDRDSDDPPFIAVRGRLGDRECIVPDLDAIVDAIRSEQRMATQDE